MIILKINNVEYELITQPTISQSKSYRGTAIYIDKTTFSVRDELGSFMPFSDNPVIDNKVLENNTVEIFEDTTKLYSGFILELEPDPMNEINVIFECVTELKKFINNRFDYNTWTRGAGAYPVGEYHSHTDGLYYETPVYAIWHYMRSLGYTNFNTELLSVIQAIYIAAGCYIQIDTAFLNMKPHIILNYLSKKFHLFVYEDDDGLITFDHGRNYSTDFISITQNIENDIQTIQKLDKYTDYKIEVGETFRTATANGNYGLQYRTEFIEPYELLTGLIYIMNNVSADYLGTFAINKFFRDRQSLRITFDISNAILTLLKGMKITALQRGWNEKLFEPYVIKRDFESRKYIVDCFEVL